MYGSFIFRFNLIKDKLRLGVIRTTSIVDLAHIDRAPTGFIQVNDGKRFDHMKTCILTGTFKIFIAAGDFTPKLPIFGRPKMTFRAYSSEQWQG